jgi:hypothetical protein
MVLTMLLACAGSPGTCQTIKESRTDAANPLTLKEVRQVEKRIPRLKRGLYPDDVFKVLRLKSDSLFGIAGGPSNGFHISYQLRSDYHLFLVFDCSGGPPGKLTYAELGKARMGLTK